MNSNTVIVRTLGSQEYLVTWLAMQQFTNQRDQDTLDEIWVLEHPPVFTQGQNGKSEHVHSPGTLPVVQTDRGGQVTYHGPGQLIIYTLIDHRRKKFTTRQFVTLLEQSVVQLLATYHVSAKAKCEAPGVYIADKKICSIGLRIRRGCSFHGLALNVAMDLRPFLSIDPCGFPGLKMAQLTEINKTANIKSVAAKLVEHLRINLGYTNKLIAKGPYGPKEP